VTRQNVLGYDLVGSGSRKVIVLNDWMCDTSTWDAARVYLDGERFSWAFSDLRGYGRSRGQSGSFSLVEATADVLALADSLNWARSPSWATP
jgi:3-oxoadipate enol-lactonase